MTHIKTMSFILRVFFTMANIALNVHSKCHGDMFLNLCGHCVGGSSKIPENMGMDLCGVCDGDNACVSCNGIIYGRDTFDQCGVCLPPNSELRNDCLKINSVYPHVIDSDINFNYVLLRVFGSGLNAASLILNLNSCAFFGRENQAEVPKIVDISAEDDDIELKVKLDNSLGFYEIICTNIEGSAGLNIVNSALWTILEVAPSRLRVDHSYEFRLTIQGYGYGNENGTIWCFVQCENMMTSFLLGLWSTSRTVSCSKYVARTSGVCTIGISATDLELPIGSNNANIYVSAPSPVVLTAEYDSDLKKIIIEFNMNIQLTKSCRDIFNDFTLQSIDENSCTLFGNLLSIMLKPSSPFLNNVVIKAGNGIRRVGSKDPNLSDECLPAVIPISHLKVPPPVLSISVPSVLCRAKEELRVSSIGSQQVNYSWIVNVPRTLKNRTSQRDNLIAWKNARSIQAKLNKKNDSEISSVIDSSELIPDNEYQVKVSGENVLGEKRVVMSSFRLSSATPVSAAITVIPGVNCLAAEITITQCSSLSIPLSFSWFLNNSLLKMSGPKIKITNLEPGVYNVSCQVQHFETLNNLNEAWAIAEINAHWHSVVLSPEEQLIGTMDFVKIFAVGANLGSLSWSCVLADDEKNNIPCLAKGPRREVIDQLVDNNNDQMLMLQPGILPVGKYIWKLKNYQSTNATVVILPGIPPRLTTTLIFNHINPVKPLRMIGEAERLTTDCSVYWKTIRRLGFNYFNLMEDTGLGYHIKVNPKNEKKSVILPLVIPAAQGLWTGLTSKASYLIRFQASCPNRSAVYVDIPIVVNVPPTVMKISVNPTEGMAILTKFRISGGEAKDILEDYPLTYKWSYQEGRRHSSPVVLDEGIFYRDFNAILPPGNITVSLEVCDIHQTCLNANSRVVKVTQSSNLSAESLRTLQLEITRDFMEDNYIRGFGKVVTILKTLNTVGMESSFYDFSSSIEFIIKSRINQIINNYDKYILSIEQAMELANLLQRSSLYFHSSETLKSLANSLLTPKSHGRFKRDDNKVSSNDCQREIEYLLSNSQYGPNFSGQIEKLLPCMCKDKEIFLESQLVSVWISKPLLVPNDLSKELFPEGKENFLKIQLNQRKFSKTTCLVIIKYDKIYFDSTFLNMSLYLASDIFDVFLTTDSEIIPKAGSSKVSQMKVHIPSTISSICYVEKSGKWTEMAECKTRDFGLFALASKEPITATTTKTSTTTTTITEFYYADPITKEMTTSTIAFYDNTTEKAVTLSPKKDYDITKDISVAIMREYFAIVNFKIEEQYEAVIGINKESLEEHFKNQLSRTYDIPRHLIHVSVSVGSIIVSVYFLKPMDRVLAAEAIKKLTHSLNTGELELTDINNNKILYVPKQNITLTLPQTPASSSALLRTAIYIVALSIFAALLILIVAYLVSKKSTLRSNRNNVSGSNEPSYMVFNNQLSLEGSNENSLHSNHQRTSIQATSM